MLFDYPCLDKAALLCARRQEKGRKGKQFGMQTYSSGGTVSVMWFTYAGHGHPVTHLTERKQVLHSWLHAATASFAVRVGCSKFVSSKYPLIESGLHNVM